MQAKKEIITASYFLWLVTLSYTCIYLVVRWKLHILLTLFKFCLLSFLWMMCVKKVYVASTCDFPEQRGANIVLWIIITNLIIWGMEWIYVWKWEFKLISLAKQCFVLIFHTGNNIADKWKSFNCKLTFIFFLYANQIMFQCFKVFNLKLSFMFCCGN